MPLRAAVRYLAGWSIILFFIVLLTLIFNFLGTIICAVLAGMMLGAGRVAKWHTLVISLFFPACIFGVLRTTKADLLGWQVVMLTILCFSVFWLSYFATAALLFYESKGPAGHAPAVEAKRLEEPATQAAVGSAEQGLLTVAALEGSWRCRARVNGHFQDKVLEIHEHRLSLSVGDAKGRLHVIGQAEVELNGNGSTQRVKLAPSGVGVDDLVEI